MFQNAFRNPKVRQIRGEKVFIIGKPAAESPKEMKERGHGTCHFFLVAADRHAGPSIILQTGFDLVEKRSFAYSFFAPDKTAERLVGIVAAAEKIQKLENL
jgi:hypothetical protein